VFDPERQLELVNLLLVGEVGEDCGAAAILQREEIPLEDAQGHLGLGRRAADDWIQRLRNLMQASESDAEVVAILEEGEVAGDPVKVNPNCCGNILPKRLDVGLVPASVPKQPLVGQTPRSFLLSKHVDKSIHVQPGTTCANAKHHACAKDPLGDVDLPVVSPAIQNPCSAHPGRPIRPVWMEMCNPLFWTVQPHLMGLVILVPAPVVLAA